VHQHLVPILSPLCFVVTATGDSVRYTHLDMAAMETVPDVAVLARAQGRVARRSLLGIQRGAHT